MLFAWAIFRYQLFDLMPRARDILMNNMQDCLFVLDEANRLVDLNPSARELIDLGGNRAIGLKPDQFLLKQPVLTGYFTGGGLERIEIQFAANGAHRWYELESRYLAGRNPKKKLRQPGKMIILRDITIRKSAELEREKLIGELQEALSKIKTLSGMLPICSSCHKIRDDNGYWNQIESYIRDHSEAEFSHSLCPDCVKKLYPDLFTDQDGKVK